MWIVLKDGKIKMENPKTWLKNWWEKEWTVWNCMELSKWKKNHHIKSFPVDWFPFHAPDWTHPFQPRGTDHGVAHATATFRYVKGRQPISLDISKTGKKNGSTRSDQCDLQKKSREKKSPASIFSIFCKKQGSILRGEVSTCRHLNESRCLYEKAGRSISCIDPWKMT